MKILMVDDCRLMSEYDAVLMDIQMPEMDGYEATRQIRNWESGFQNDSPELQNPKSQILNLKSQIPIIAMAADTMTGVSERCLEAGMNDYVTKPIDPDERSISHEKTIQNTDNECGVSSGTRCE